MAKSLNLLKEVKAVIERIEEHDVAAENGDLFQMIGEKYKDNIVEFLRILKLVESEINDCLKKVLLRTIKICILKRALFNVEIIRSLKIANQQANGRKKWSILAVTSQ